MSTMEDRFADLEAQIAALKAKCAALEAGLDALESWMTMTDETQPAPPAPEAHQPATIMPAPEPVQETQVND